MRFFFPDSQDQIDPSFDFLTERRSPLRVRQRDDYYAHEALGEAVYDGLLISKAMVDGTGVTTASYTQANRQRLLRSGVRRFYRLDKVKGPRIETMGDCGAFSYLKEEKPPYSVEEVSDFYETCGFDYGVSVDHVILGFQEDGLDVPPDWRRRQEITLEMAEAFWQLRQKRKPSYIPVGVAQGWSPASYAHSVNRLQEIGYTRIGLGGMVPLKTPEILSSLRAINEVRQPGVQLHIFGISRCEHLANFAQHGVTSIDSTSAFRQAFKDEKNNYHTLDGNYLAIRVPQVDGNPKLKRLIKAGEVSQDEAMKLERLCLDRLRAYDRREIEAAPVVEALRAYERLYDGKKDRSEKYLEALVARPWQECPCSICKKAGIDVIIFRGSERNKRRGFHNLYVFYEKLKNLNEPSKVKKTEEKRSTHAYV